MKSLTIDYDYYNSNENNFDDLKEAVAQLTNASEQQFTEIKSEKWFNRVFDMITFSQKGKKRVAEQIGSLAQAQEILIDILLRLSSSDEKVAGLVQKSFENIKRLQENDAFLLNKIKALENTCLLGIKKSSDIADLSERDKQILSGCLYYLLNCYENTSEEQKKYANAVLNYTGAEASVDNISNAIAEMDVVSRKKVLVCCMEYIFLFENNLNMSDTVQEFIDEFDFGSKTLREVNNQVLNTFRLRGIDGFINKYSQNEFADYEEEFFIEDGLVDEDTISECEEEPESLEDFTITSIFQINEDSSQTISFKNIRINSYINCEGTLEIKNSVIHYNDTNESGQITIGKHGSLILNNCAIICHGFNSFKFIKGGGSGCSKVIFENCTFLNCSNFLDILVLKEFSMKKCKVSNCFDGFCRVRTRADDFIVNISENIIFLNDITEYNLCQFNDGSLFSLSCGYEDNSTGIISNNLIIESQLFKDKLHKKCSSSEWCRFILFNVDNTSVKGCTFLATSNCLDGAFLVENCMFQDCTDVIHTPLSSIGNNSNPHIENCCFEHCTDILQLTKNNMVSYCLFLECYNSLMSNYFAEGGININFCHFINAKNAYILLNNGNPTNKIKQCIFDGIEMDEEFLISAGRCVSKQSNFIISVEDCNFMNCSTKHNSNKIIKEYSHYSNFFNKLVDYHAVSISNCRGLDKINQESSRSNKTDIKKVSSNGRPIGSSLISSLETPLSAEAFEMESNAILENKGISIGATGIVAHSIMNQ